MRVEDLESGIDDAFAGRQLPSQIDGIGKLAAASKVKGSVVNASYYLFALEINLNLKEQRYGSRSSFLLVISCHEILVITKVNFGFLVWV